MKKTICLLLIATTILCLCGCGRIQEPDVGSDTSVTPAAAEAFPALEDIPDSQNDRFADIGKCCVGDIDNSGYPEYVVVERISGPDSNDSICRYSYYLNNVRIYEAYYDTFALLSENSVLIDLDGDGKDEIFFDLYPEVNSVPGMDFAVLKQYGDIWYPMDSAEMPGLISGFPVYVYPTDQKDIYKISCVGSDKVFTFDAAEYYADNTYEGLASDYEDAVNSGRKFGEVGSWGLYSVEPGTDPEGNPCLIATESIWGPSGKWNILGTATIYFSYYWNHIKVTDFDFKEYEPEADSEND